MARALWIIGNADTMECWQGQDINCIVLNSWGSEMGAPASINESIGNLALNEKRAPAKRSSNISYVPLVELSPAVQKPTRGMGLLPVVVWFHHSCFAGSKIETVPKSINPAVIPLFPIPFCPPIAINIPAGPKDGTYSRAPL